MRLPDLKLYRSTFEKKGISLPLSPVPFEQKGLLGVLPKPNLNQTGWPWTQETDPKVYSIRGSWPKLTIVSPSYNQDKFLEQTIRSVLLQNYPNLEYIIIDGGSTDDSKQILEKYSRWISYWQSEKDEGQGHAINLGFSLASGNHYAWINSDDYYTKDSLFTVASAFLSSQTDFVYGYGYNLNTVKNELELVKILPVLDYFIKIPGIIQPSAFWSAGIHQPIWEELHCALDFELWLRLVKGRSRRLVKKTLSVAHVHDDAKTSDPKMKQKWHEDHLKIWSAEAHGTVHEWKRIIFLNRIRQKLYKLLHL